MGSDLITPAALLDKARAKEVRIATAESCTGGLVAAALTAIPGSSDVVECGFVTYSNAAKQKILGVTAATLEAYGAVSELVASQMASGAVARSDAELAISITGIAGPGGSEHKPEGRVCFAVADRSGIVACDTVEFGPLGRAEVRSASVQHALDMMARALDQ